jgi:hypothetical protein
MMYLIAGLAAVGVACFVWLVATTKVTLPLLADLGLTVLALGTIVWADAAVMRGEILSPLSALMIVSGLSLLAFAFIRKRGKRHHRSSNNGPIELDEVSMQRATGGKQP